MVGSSSLPSGGFDPKATARAFGRAARTSFSLVRRSGKSCSTVVDAGQVNVFPDGAYGASRLCSSYARPKVRAASSGIGTRTLLASCVFATKHGAGASKESPWLAPTYRTARTSRRFVMHVVVQMVSVFLATLTKPAMSPPWMRDARSRPECSASQVDETTWLDGFS